MLTKSLSRDTYIKYIESKNISPSSSSFLPRSNTRSSIRTKTLMFNNYENFSSTVKSVKNILSINSTISSPSMSNFWKMRNSNKTQSGDDVSIKNTSLHKRSHTQDKKSAPFNKKKFTENDDFDDSFRKDSRKKYHRTIKSSFNPTKNDKEPFILLRKKESNLNLKPKNNDIKKTIYNKSYTMNHLTNFPLKKKTITLFHRTNSVMTQVNKKEIIKNENEEENGKLNSIIINTKDDDEDEEDTLNYLDILKSDMSNFQNSNNSNSPNKKSLFHRNESDNSNNNKNENNNKKKDKKEKNNKDTNVPFLNMLKRNIDNNSSDNENIKKSTSPQKYHFGC